MNNIGLYLRSISETILLELMSFMPLGSLELGHLLLNDADVVKRNHRGYTVFS
jgi:hypothetical protein